MKSYIQQNTTRKTNYRIEELKNEIEEAKAELKEVEAIPNKTFDDLENIRMFNNLIKDCLNDIEEEEKRESVPEFREYKAIKREYTNQLIKKYKKESSVYQKFTNEYLEKKNEHLIYTYEDDFDNEVNVYEDGYDDFKEFVKYQSQVKDLEEEFKQQAEKVVKDMEDNGEFEKYYLVASGKQEYLNKVEKLEQIKQESLKLNDILNNYSVKFTMMTFKDFETYKTIWEYLYTSKFINEPCEFKTEPLFKIKYLNKLYEVYKFEVAESEFMKRVKAKSTISNRTRDFKNIYLKKI